jgi:hypothetical protein
MEFEKKIELINDFAGSYIDAQDEEVQSFFKLNNLGIPFCIGITNEYISLNTSGKFLIDETWNSLCEFLDIPEDEEYEDLYEMIDYSIFNGDH